MGIFSRSSDLHFFDLDGIAARVAAPIEARFAGEEEDEEDESEGSVAEVDDWEPPSEGGQEPSGEEDEEEDDEDDFEEVLPDGSISAETKARDAQAAVKKAKKAKVKKKSKKKKSLTCEQMRKKLHVAEGKLWKANLLTADRSKYQSEADSWKAKMKKRGCSDVPL